MGYYRTESGLNLEKIFSELKHRYLFCWNGEPEGSTYDCGCCMTWPDDATYRVCGCVCHERIEEMANLPHIKLWLVAMKSMGELPPFFSSRQEKLAYCIEQAKEHEAHRNNWGTSILSIPPCPCEYCRFAREEARWEQAPLVGAGVEQPCPPPCNLPPEGWVCPRGAGHEGPCAATEEACSKDQD